MSHMYVIPDIGPEELLKFISKSDQFSIVKNKFTYEIRLREEPKTTDVEPGALPSDDEWERHDDPVLLLKIGVPDKGNSWFEGYGGNKGHIRLLTAIIKFMDEYFDTGLTYYNDNNNEYWEITNRLAMKNLDAALGECFRRMGL